MCAINYSYMSALQKCYHSVMNEVISWFNKILPLLALNLLLPPLAFSGLASFSLDFASSLVLFLRLFEQEHIHPLRRLEVGERWWGIGQGLIEGRLLVQNQPCPQDQTFIVTSLDQ